ncbi:DUF2313 domain-containing protein [Caulobacter sp. SLTY]|uniref:YmfQ family protein n=1 Tax=Caulobacter sp. SLTY TaxID=2683262 RepID=UPI001412643D|nr:putative phage tail protein [Caulobacter sp. SLTY]NBB17562.1 DUF2313 domain-containing protein [Caulobacter sp. SLTY]
MPRDANAFAAAFEALLPQGLAWARNHPLGLGDLFTGMAQEFARLDQRVEDLFEEADPRTTYELIDEWESQLGLPDPCTAAAVTLNARQVVAWRKLAIQAGQTPAFYVALAASLGFDIEIHEFDPAVDVYDGALTALIAGGKYRYVWRVHVLTETDFSVFRTGESDAGDLLSEGGGLDVECVINAAKPSHTHVIFTYEEP